MAVHAGEEVGMVWRTAIFGDLKLGEERWRPGRTVGLTVVFGEGKVDFRQADMEDETSLRVVAVFGDVDVSVPEDTAVDLTGFSLFSDRKVRRRGKEPPSVPVKRLNIDATTVFSDLTVTG